MVEEDKNDENIAEKVKIQRRFFRLGPPTVLLSFSRALAAIVLTDLIVYRTCLVSLNINATECIMLRTNTGSPEAMNLETKAEPYASMILMTKSLLENILPAVLSLFLGPWSDRGGRRPLLLATFTGFTITYFSLSLICVWNISPWYLLFGSMPSTITGGFCIVILASVCRISDTTEENDRMVDLSLLEASICGGEVLGILIGPLIYKSYGDTNVFRTAAICCTLALAYVYFFIPETVKNASQESIQGLFKITFVKELITSTFVKRVDFDRQVVWFVIPILASCRMILIGHMTIEFLFVRARLGWDLPRYSYYSATDVGLRITGLCTISILTLLLGVSDTLLAGIALVSALGDAVTKSLAWQSWHMYLSVCIGIFTGAIEPVMRSIISKSVPAQEVGKIFSLTAFLQALSPLGGAPLYTLIYSHNLPPIYPLPAYLFTTSILVSSILGLFNVHMLLRKPRKLFSYISASRDEIR